MTIDDIEKVKRAVIRKYDIAANIALEGINIELDKSIPTAAVVGEKNDDGVLEVKKIVVNPDFFAKLNFSQRVFVLAHEVFHIAFKHFSRSIDKPEKDAEIEYEKYCEEEFDEKKREIMKSIIFRKYHRIWNIATDACINAFLKKDGLAFPDNVIDERTGKKMQFIDMEEGMTKSAEKIYDYLVEKEKTKKEEQNDDTSKKNKEQQENGNSSGDSNTSIDDIDIDDYSGIDSHESWEKACSQNNDIDPSNSKNTEDTVDEEELFKKITQNQKEKDRKGEGTKTALSKLRGSLDLDDVGYIKPVVSWRAFLVGTLEKYEEVWGTRRASRYNPNARIEERAFEALPTNIEVILDASGSVSSALLKGFLMQLLTLYECVAEDEVSIKIGCFGTDFTGFKLIRTRDDIKNYQISSMGGTNFEVAATSFTKDLSGNTVKIAFTDGCLGIPQTTRVDDIIWIVFDDYANFKPIGGRIINVSKSDCENMIKDGMGLLSDEIVEKKIR